MVGMDSKRAISTFATSQVTSKVYSGPLSGSGVSCGGGGVVTSGGGGAGVSGGVNGGGGGCVGGGGGGG